MERVTKTIHTLAAASVLAFCATAFSATPGAARAGLIAASAVYCPSYPEGGTDCSFKSYAQCEATASRINAERYGSSFHSNEGFQRRHAGEYLGPITGIQ